MMKNINEDILRIKSLMNIVQEQLELDFDDNTDDTNTESNITIESPEFTKPFKEKVFFILKDIYGNTNWSNEEGRGTRGRGGFVNIYTVYDLMKEKGLDDYEQEGGDWSIINYFDTNPQVRKYLVNLWEKETSNSLLNRFPDRCKYIPLKKVLRCYFLCHFYLFALLYSPKSVKYSRAVMLFGLIQLPNHLLM